MMWIRIRSNPHSFGSADPDPDLHFSPQVYLVRSRLREKCYFSFEHYKESITVFLPRQGIRIVNLISDVEPDPVGSAFIWVRKSRGINFRENQS